MGLTEKGYQRRTFDDILKDKINRAKELFGEDIDTSDQGILGKILRINAYDQALSDELNEAVYYSGYPNTASGQSLDRLLPLAGIVRNPASAAVYSVEVSGTAGHVIPAGFIVGTESELTYATEQEYTIGSDGSVIVNAICTLTGTVGNLSGAGAICKVVNTDADISTVKGLECLISGKDDESDADLRMRFAAAVQGSGSSNENAIRAAILRVPTVRFAAVISNDEGVEDDDGRPPHSFECYVMGGEDYEQEIAEAIFEKRPIGIKTVGDKSVTITDISGNERIVNYSPAPIVPVTVKAIVKKTTAFPDDGVTLIQSNVANYINGIGIGTSLILSTIYRYIYEVAGVAEVTTLELSTDGGSTYSSENVVVPKYGVAVCANVHVEVDA